MKTAILRTLALSAALAAALAGFPAGAEDDQVLTLEVGESKVIGGFGGVCDDLTVATITQDANATVRALHAGTTLCSSRVGGPGGGVRKVYRVVVVEAGGAGRPSGPAGSGR